MKNHLLGPTSRVSHTPDHRRLAAAAWGGVDMGHAHRAATWVLPGDVQLQPHLSSMQCVQHSGHVPGKSLLQSLLPWLWPLVLWALNPLDTYQISSLIFAPVLNINLKKKRHL